MVIDCNVALVTARAIVFDVTPLCAAVMLLDPTPTPFATPPELIVIVDVLEETHVAEFVRFCVVPSLKVPVAVKSSTVPLAMEAVPAVILIDCRIAALTVSASVFEVTPFCVAVMLLDPTPAPVARPLALIAAAAGFDEVQTAEFVKL